MRGKGGGKGCVGDHAVPGINRTSPLRLAEQGHLCSEYIVWSCRNVELADLDLGTRPAVKGDKTKKKALIERERDGEGVYVTERDE